MPSPIIISLGEYPSPVLTLAGDAEAAAGHRTQPPPLLLTQLQGDGDMTATTRHLSMYHCSSHLRCLNRSATMFKILDIKYILKLPIKFISIFWSVNLPLKEQL